MGPAIDVQRLRREILEWMDPPRADRHGRVAARQIRRLVEALEQPSARDDLFLSRVAEAVLARRLLEAGCTIDIERPTAGGRHADFHVRGDGAEFWLHVKRVSAPAPAAGAAPAVPGALAALAGIARPVAVAVRWSPAADGAGLDALRAALEPFVREASVGDELVVRAEGGAWLGSARIAAPTASGHVELRAGADAGWEAMVPRVQRLLRKAYSQFMPGAANVICLASESSAALEPVETALLGTVIERWDRFPPRGHRVAHGRADDGFWSRGQFVMSTTVAWFPLDGRERPRVWRRDTADLRAAGAVERLVRRVLGAEPA